MNASYPLVDAFSDCVVILIMMSGVAVAGRAGGNSYEWLGLGSHSGYNDCLKAQGSCGFATSGGMYNKQAKR
eukprot:6439153-Amphidinium_carterae.1